MMRGARSLWRVSLVVLAGCLVLAGASSGATVGGRVVFSVNGNAVEFSGGGDGGQVDASVALPDGDVVLVGGSIVADSTFFAAELQPDGSLDRSFGVNGVAQVPLPLSAVGVLREPDGKLLVLATGPALSKFQLPQLMVVRLDANGTLDQTYGVDGDGVARTGLEGFGAGAISADGELLVTGTTARRPLTPARRRTSTGSSRSPPARARSIRRSAETAPPRSPSSMRRAISWRSSPTVTSWPTAYRRPSI